MAFAKMLLQRFAWLLKHLRELNNDHSVLNTTVGVSSAVVVLELPSYESLVESLELEYPTTARPRTVYDRKWNAT